MTSPMSPSTPRSSGGRSRARPSGPRRSTGTRWRTSGPAPRSTTPPLPGSSTSRRSRRRAHCPATPRSSTSGASLRLRSVSLGTLVEPAVEAALPSAEAAGLRLERRIDAVPEAVADPGRIGQLLDNLVANAVSSPLPGSGDRVALAPARLRASAWPTPVRGSRPTSARCSSTASTGAAPRRRTACRARASASRSPGQSPGAPTARPQAPMWGSGESSMRTTVPPCPLEIETASVSCRVIQRPRPRCP